MSWQRLGMDRACGAAPANEGRKALEGGQCLRRVAVWKDRAGGADALTERERRRTKTTRCS